MAGKAAPLTYYVETAPGLEEVAWIEVRRRLPQAQFREFHFARDERGIVVFDAAAPPGALFSLRTIHAAYIAGAYLNNTSRGYRDLRLLREQMARSGDFGRAVNGYSRHRRRQIGSYRLIVRTYGRHEYNRQAVRRAVIQGIDALYPGWQRAQQETDVELWANVLGSTILVGLRLPFAAAPQAGATGLPPVVAEALALLTDPDESDHFLDPFPKNGAIAAARGRYPLTQLYVGAGEPKGAKAARGRLEGDGGAPLSTVRWQDGQLALPRQAVDKVATWLPEVQPAEDTTGRYGAWLREVERVLKPGGRAAIFTHAYEQFKNAVREAPLLEIRGGYSLTVAKQWGRIYLLERLDSEA